MQRLSRSADVVDVDAGVCGGPGLKLLELELGQGLGLGLEMGLETDQPPDLVPDPNLELEPQRKMETKLGLVVEEEEEEDEVNGEPQQYPASAGGCTRGSGHTGC